MKATRYFTVTILVGVGAGLGGMLLALLLHEVQHLAFGYSVDEVISHESFLAGISAASPLRRFIVLTLCGVIAGCGWWLLYRHGKPLKSIAKALESDDPRMPVLSTILHAVLQIVTVATGSPLGREVAPREIGALWAGWLAHGAGLSPAQVRVMVACGAGAGLAAVYNVPFGGAVFVLEVLLVTFDAGLIATALVTSTIAALVARTALGNVTQYILPPMTVDTQLIVWAIVTSPLFGAAAWLFVRLTVAARSKAPRDQRLPLFALLDFMMIGALVIFYPQLAGNGRTPAGLAFGDELTFALAGVLLVLRVLIVVTSLRAGAQGGLLTPGLTNGALLAVVLGSAWNGFWPGTPLGAFAVVGAGAFLSASMRMPLTALVLMSEFTRFDHAFMVPSALAVAGSTAVFRLIETFAQRREQARDATDTTEPAQPA